MSIHYKRMQMQAMVSGNVPFSNSAMMVIDRTDLFFCRVDIGRRLVY
jgi:hypothetical protein